MAIDCLEVHLGGRFAGTVRRNQRDRLSFTYDEAYRAGADATPLSCCLSLAGATHPDKRIRPFLWGLLPDNEQVLERWARQFRVSALRPLELLAQVGRDLPGAVELLEPGAPGPTGVDAVEWLDEREVAAELRRVREDEAAWLAPTGRGRWSLAGRHPKVALVYADGRYGRPSASTPTNRILKPAISGYDDYDVNEHLCLAAANRCGLLTAASELVAFDGERAVVVHRFDRRPLPEGGFARLHQEDMCQALAVHPAAKYEDAGGPSAGTIAALLRAEIPGDAGTAALWRFFDALVFNWLIAAPDAHAKNYSLLHLGRAVRLAPLYDLASALPYPGFYPPKVKLAMRVGGHYRVGVLRASSWTREAEQLGLPAGEALVRARELARAVPDAFADARGALELDGPAEEVADKLVRGVMSNAATCAQRLG